MAQVWTVYSSTDSGAPVCNSSAASLISVLEGCLVTGYGLKSPAGWSKPFSTANKAVFLPSISARSRMYVDVDDSFGGYASVATFETMSAVGTGTGPCGQVLGVPVRMIWGKSASGPRPWYVFADDRTFVFISKSGLTNGTYSNVTLDRWSPWIAGEFYSYRANDAWQFLISGGVENVGYDSHLLHVNNDPTNWNVRVPGLWIQRLHDGAPGAVVASVNLFNLLGGQTTGSYGSGVDCPNWVQKNPADGKIWMMPIGIRTFAPSHGLRGEIRGMRWSISSATGFNTGATTVDAEGKPWMFFQGQTTTFQASAGQILERGSGFWMQLSLPPSR